MCPSRPAGWQSCRVSSPPLTDLVLGQHIYQRMRKGRNPEARKPGQRERQTGCWRKRGESRWDHREKRRCCCGGEQEKGLRELGRKGHRESEAGEKWGGGVGGGEGRSLLGTLACSKRVGSEV